MNEIILLKLGELVLKGLNRRSFEDKLIGNARRRLKDLGKFRVYTKQSTMYVEPAEIEESPRRLIPSPSSAGSFQMGATAFSPLSSPPSYSILLDRKSVV